MRKSVLKGERTMITISVAIEQKNLEEVLRNAVNNKNDDGSLRNRIIKNVQKADESNIKEAKEIQALLKENVMSEDVFIERLKHNLERAHLDEITVKGTENGKAMMLEAKFNLDYERLIERMKPIETKDELEEVLDELDVKYNLKEGYCLIEFWTDTAGQDVCYELDSDDVEEIISGFTEYAEEYDVGEEVSIWEGSRGKKGVPDDYETLVADIKEAKETLLKIAERLNEGVKDEGRKEKRIERE